MSSAPKSKPKDSTPKFRQHMRWADFDAQLNGRDDDESLESEKAIQDTVSRLNNLYDEGVPFFSKAVFQAIVAQLDAGRAEPRPHKGPNPHIISVPAVDGTTIKFKLETGIIESYRQEKENDTEFVAQDPHLYYETIEHLSDKGRLAYTSRHLVCCPTRITYPMLPRRISTKEPISLWKTAPPEEVQAAFDAGVKAWEASEDCQQLRALFQTVPLPKVNKIVAFACSTMAMDGVGDGRNRQIYQHALILTMRDIFENRSDAEKPVKVQCFAQDPIYTKIDEDVLGRAGITVLGDPRGFLEVDEQSVVISFAPNIPVRQIIADIARPAVMIWDRVKSETEAIEFWAARGGDFKPGNTCDPESTRLRVMVQDYYHEPTTIGPEKAFGNAAVYIRRT